MYIAKFELGGRPVAQAAVRMAPLGVAAARAHRVIVQSVFATMDSIPELMAAFRVEFKGRAISQSWKFTCPLGEEESLRRFVSEFTRLEAASGVGVEFPESAGTFDAMMAPFPPGRVAATCLNFRREGVWFASGFRLHRKLNLMIAEAAVQGVDFTYQAHFSPNDMDGEAKRAMLVNANALRSLKGVRPWLAEAQEARARTAMTLPWLIEEFVGCQEGGLSWLTRFIEKQFSEEFAGAGFDSPAFAADEGIEDAQLDAGLHHASVEPVSAAERCECAVGREEVLAVLTWTPGPMAAALLPTVPPESGGDGSGRGQAPTAPRPAGDYGFVSYAHKDTASVEAVVNAARAAGLALWWDHQIPGAVEWDAHLEEQIAAAKAIVLFLSQAAVESKYVRREVKYADGIGKRILAIELSPCQLQHGMAMLLNQYQRIPVTRADLLDQLRRMI